MKEDVEKLENEILYIKHKVNALFAEYMGMSQLDKVKDEEETVKKIKEKFLRPYKKELEKAKDIWKDSWKLLSKNTAVLLREKEWKKILGFFNSEIETAETNEYVFTHEEITEKWNKAKKYFEAALDIIKSSKGKL